MIHWQPAFERTKQNICIAMHIALDQGHSQIQSGDVGACKSNYRSNAQAFFLLVFPRIQHILPTCSKICQVPIGLGRQKNMYMHCVVDCSHVLGQEGARMLPHGNLPVEPSQHAAIPKKKLRKNVPN